MANGWISERLARQAALIKRWRREQSRVYREARGGMMDKQDAAKLIWMLGEIRKSIETHEIEQRLSDLEERTDGRPALPAPRAH